MFSFCMYCCKERCAAITLSIFSALFILTSAASIFLTHRLKQSSYIWDLQEDPNMDSQIEDPVQDITTVKEIVYWGIIGLCGLAILTGILGFFNAWKKTCCTIGLYSFFTLIMMIAFLLIGGLLMTVTVAANMQVTEYCQFNSTSHNSTSKSTNDTQSLNLRSIQEDPSSTTSNNYEQRYDGFTINFSRYFLNYFDEYQSATVDLVGTYMCKKDCPCVAIDNASYPPEGFQNPPMYQDGKYSSFAQCYADLVTDQKISTPISNPMLSVIKYLEDKYQCSSLCDSTIPDFGFYKDINSGRITQSCGQNIQKLVNQTLGLLALLLLVTALMIFLAFNAQYGLWRRRFSQGKSLRSAINESRGDRSKNYLVE